MKYTILFLAILGMIACRTKTETTASAEEVKVLRTAVVESQPALVEVAGTVQAADVAQLASRFGGFVQSVPVVAGNRVRKGDLLVLLDDRGLQAQADRTKGTEQEALRAIEEAAQHLRAAESGMRLATNTFERIHALRDRNSASQQEFEEAQSRSEGAEAEWRAAQERLDQARARLSQVRAGSQEVQAGLSYQRIIAPFDGRVVSAPANAGSFVNPGQTLVVLENPSRFQLVFAVEQEVLVAIATGASVPVIVPAVSNSPIDATIAEISPGADSSTRTYAVKANLPALPSLQSGLNGTARLNLASRKSLWIPAEFLKTHQDIETVTVQSKDQWRRILVKSGVARDGKVEMLSGLNEGDRVAILEVSR